MKSIKNNKYIQFIFLTLFMSFIFFTGIICFIILITHHSTTQSKYTKAIEWQMSTKGVVSINNRVSKTYKKRFIAYRLSQEKIDTVFLGSSTMMSLQPNLLKKENIYNNAKSGNTLRESIAEAKYLIHKYPHIKNIFIGYDWVIGKTFIPYQDLPYEDLFQEKKLSISAKIQDAVSYQRFKITFLNLLNKIFSKETNYICPNGKEIGSDAFFDPLIPNKCTGFRYDGSSTFNHVQPVDKTTYLKYLSGDINQHYKNNVLNSKGILDSQYLNNFKEINAILQARGGQLYIIIPPLIPHIEDIILKDHTAKGYLDMHLNQLYNFSKKHHFTVMNFSKSESYGCNFEDFVDVHHPFNSCWKKIFKSEAIQKSLQGIEQ